MTRVAPGRARRTSRTSAIAAWRSSAGMPAAKRTWRRPSGPASRGAVGAEAAPRAAARASSGRAGSSRSGASASRSAGSTVPVTGSGTPDGRPGSEPGGEPADAAGDTEGDAGAPPRSGDDAAGPVARGAPGGSRRPAPPPTRVRVREPVAVGARAAPRPAPIGGRDLGGERLLPRPPRRRRSRGRGRPGARPPRLDGRPGRRRGGSRPPARSARSARRASGRRPPRSIPGGPRGSPRPSSTAPCVMTVRTPVTIPPTTTRWPSSDSSLRSPE